MNTLTDTTPEADALVLHLLRQTPIWRKLQLMDQLNEMTRSLALSNLRQQHPDVDAAELHRLLAERLFGREMASKLFNDHAEASTNAL